jgi:hypothetical protein
VLDTGAIDHDAHSGLVADEIDHQSGAPAATGGRTVGLRRQELAVGGLVEPGGEGKVVGEAPVCAQVAVGRGRHRGGEKVIALGCKDVVEAPRRAFIVVTWPPVGRPVGFGGVRM